MENKNFSLPQKQPRLLHYRKHFRWYARLCLVWASFSLVYWGAIFLQLGVKQILSENLIDLGLTALSLAFCFSYYFFYLRPRIKGSVQIFDDYIQINKEKSNFQLPFKNMIKVSSGLAHSFEVEFADKSKHKFTSAIERIDYVWEGLFEKRPELFHELDFEAKRLKLLQADHHQKRKEWFFQNKMLDIVNWCVLPIFLLLLGYTLQSHEIQINFSALYFFRLSMYLVLAIILTNFIFSLSLKKLIFDRKLATQLEHYGEKQRDIKHEERIIEQTKYIQMVLVSVLFFGIILSDLNFYSLTKIKKDQFSFGLEKGSTLVVDNRFNCSDCRFSIQEGDIVVFGKGYLGKVLAVQGETIAFTQEDGIGRSIASETMQEVPKGSVAIKTNEAENQIVIVEMHELIGRVKN